jgi:oxygen-independent coproporphyrinogen-3 oxidase
MADLEASLPLIWAARCIAEPSAAARPACFSPQAIDRLLADIRARLRLTPDCEITLITPAPFEKDRSAFAPQELRGCPSVQSFHDQFLTALGRVHDWAQAIAVEEAASAFETLQPDVMRAAGPDLEQKRRIMRGAGAAAAAHFDLPPDH